GSVYFSAPTPKLSARTLLYVQQEQPKIFYNVADHRSFEMYQRMQVAMVRSRLVFMTALNDPQVADLPIVKEKPDPVTWLEGEIWADFEPGPEIMRIGMSGTMGTTWSRSLTPSGRLTWSRSPTASTMNAGKSSTG